MDRPKTVFISYAEEDKNKAIQLYNNLKSQGINAWIDCEDLLPGENQREGITQSIKKSSYFLALLSSHSINKRGFIQKQQKMAIDILGEFPPNDIFVIPVHLDACEPQDEKLQALHWVDLSSSSSYNAGFQKILQVLKPKSSQNPENFEKTPHFFHRLKYKLKNNADALNFFLIVFQTAIALLLFTFPEDIRFIPLLLVILVFLLYFVLNFWCQRLPMIHAAFILIWGIVLFSMTFKVFGSYLEQETYRRELESKKVYLESRKAYIEQRMKQANRLWKTIDKKSELNYVPSWETQDKQLIITEQDTLENLIAKIYLSPEKLSNADEDVIWRINKIEYFEQKNQKLFLFAKDNITPGNKILNIIRTIYQTDRNEYKIVAQLNNTRKLFVERKKIDGYENDEFLGGIFPEEWFLALPPPLPY